MKLPLKLETAVCGFLIRWSQPSRFNRSLSRHPDAVTLSLISSCRMSGLVEIRVLNPLHVTTPVAAGYMATVKWGLDPYTVYFHSCLSLLCNRIFTILLLGLWHTRGFQGLFNSLKLLDVWLFQYCAWVNATGNPDKAISAFLTDHDHVTHVSTDGAEGRITLFSPRGKNNPRSVITAMSHERGGLLVV